MIRWLYATLMWLAQPLLRRKLLRRSKQEPGYALCIGERFGRYDTPVPAHDGPTLWVHAVSLGETRAAAGLVTALREALPKMRLLLTHGTATGRAEGVKLLRPGDLQAWQPWDTPGAVQRFLTHFKPGLGVLMETEVWPNLAAGCAHMGVPLVLVNARLSDKSLRQAQRLAWLARPAFAALTAVWAQTAKDAERLQALGANVQGVLGNLKFDATPQADQLALGRQWRAQLGQPVVMFASSREGEELALLQSLKAFRPLAQVNSAQVAINSVASEVQWLIVPRHPQRFDEVAALIESHGFAVQRRSSWGQGGPAASAPVDFPLMPTQNVPPTIWLGDSLGEMALYYGLADVALLGGSFEPLGGQNLIEAAACGCPVVMGPHTFNFLDAAEQALAAGAAMRVADLAQGMRAACGVALSQTEHQVMVQASTRFFEQNRGAVQQTALAVVQLLHQHSVDGGQIVSHQ